MKPITTDIPLRKHFVRIAVFAILLVTPSLFNVSLAQQSELDLLPEDLDQYIAQVLERFEVPGASVSVVKDGKTLLAKGYGVKAIGKPDLVDDQTLFCIASNTKAFTATLLAMLVEEGTIGWDDPVIDHLPWFRMADSYTTNHMTIEDLLVHRSGLGLGAGDLLQFPPTTYTRREIAERLKDIPLSSSFRQRYAYDNILYLVASELVQEVTGTTWEENVETRIFDKLGMKQSVPRISALMQKPNIAYPHTPVNGVVTLGKNFPDIRMGDVSNAAGGISSNAQDMAKWLLLQLDSGLNRVSGERLYSPATAERLWTAVTPMPLYKPIAPLVPLTQIYSGYGLGFRVHNFREHKLVTHTGGLSGAYYSRVALLPELNLGVAVLTNQESSAAYDAIVHDILDYFSGEKQRFDWLEGHTKLDSLRKLRIADWERSSADQRDSTSSPSLSLRAYEGTYRDAWYGDVSVTLVGGKLRINFEQTPAMEGLLEHWQYDTFVARWDDRSLKSDAFVSFVIDPDGKVEEVRMKAFSPAVNFSRDFHDLELFPVEN
ncbi:serine hydrolase [Parapedobacter tibetensis]|uniref:serine hydrolase n=1 Tax=Parapedobacter tibetensis TaxID=2972951 RepID=UPI00214D9693|nr:serine hydrolase [Parapedobacter tibetensis]